MRWLSGVPVGLRSHFVGATPDTLDLNGRLRRGSLCHEVACRAVAGETSEGWWARQDSNLQPDRYERQNIDQLRCFFCGFMGIRSRSLHFDQVVSGAKLVRRL